jgi:hypothetical protein
MTTLAIALQSGRRPVSSGPEDELAHDRCPPHRRVGLRQYLTQVGPHCANSAPIKRSTKPICRIGDATSRCRLHGRPGCYDGVKGAASATATENPFRKTALPAPCLTPIEGGAHTTGPPPGKNSGSPANALQAPVRSRPRGRRRRRPPCRQVPRPSPGLSRLTGVDSSERLRRRDQPLRPMTERCSAAYRQSIIAGQPNTDRTTESRTTVSQTPAETCVLAVLLTDRTLAAIGTELSVGRPTAESTSKTSTGRSAPPREPRL